MFEKIWGQQNAKTILEGIIKNQKPAHAYLFSGPVGCGKKLLAKAFAQSLNCQKIDLMTVEPQGSSLKIDQIRELKTLTQYGPAQSPYQVVILNDAHNLTSEAANSFLKILEEPAPRVIFILITDREHALFQTIKSRCQKICFGPLTKEEINNIFLVCNYSVENLSEIIDICGGSAGQALKLQEIFNELIWIRQDFQKIKNFQPVDLFELAEKISRSENLEFLLQTLLACCRRPRTAKLVFEALKNLRWKANPRLTLEIMLLKLKEEACA